MTFKERLEFLFDERNITPYKLSKDTGITQAGISRWRSMGMLPDGSTLIKLADYFDVSIDYLVGRDDVPNRKEINK